MAERRYWDSDCFLGWLQEEPGKVDKCGDVLALCERGRVEIVASTLAIAEVLMLRPKDALPKERRAKVESHFARKYIHTMAVTRRIAESGRDLVWDHGVAPKDAVHVASALSAKADVLNTFDGSLIAKSGLIGNPPLIIEIPTVTAPELDLDGQGDQDPA